eukprot:m.337144 g.337144  ORF g.337144 m.337144 type:complete len:109 (-) comp18059_c0_seq1:229-555(-)
MAAWNPELYREGSLGCALVDALDEMVMDNQITDSLRTKMLLQYDKSITHVMAEHVKNKLKFEAKCKTFNHMDLVWKFQLSDVTIKLDEGATLDVPNVKVVACDAKGVK